GGTCFTVHGADVAVMVTTSDFTAPALEYAEQCGIVCVNGPDLQRWRDGTGPSPWEVADAEGWRGGTPASFLPFSPRSGVRSGRTWPSGRARDVEGWGIGNPRVCNCGVREAAGGASRRVLEPLRSTESCRTP